MQREEEQNLLFPIQTRQVPREEYPWYQLQPPGPRAQRTSLPAMGALSRGWKWGTAFLPAMVAWLQDLEWLPADDTLPQGQGFVSFMELALDFETHAGRPLSPTPRSRFTGTELSLQEKGRVLRLAVTLMGKAVGKESILLARITNHCRSLVPLGVGPVVGVKGRPFFPRPMAVWHHMKRLQKYNAERWAQQQQARVAKQRQKRRRAQGHLANGRNDSPRPRERCPGKGGAKKAARAYASEFYAGPVLPERARRGVQYRVEEPSGEAATPAPGGGAVLSHHHSCAPWLGARKIDRDSRGCGFALHTITNNAPRARRWEGGCGTAAPGDIRGTPPPYRYRPGRRAARGRRGCAPPRGGGDPSAKRPKRRQQASVRGGRAFKRRRGHPDPPPPGEAGASGVA